jgi:hypothetical protein
MQNESRRNKGKERICFIIRQPLKINKLKNLNLKRIREL